VLSAVGDVSLVFPTGFLLGLSAFFLAHLCYIATFAPGAVATGASAMAAIAIVVVACGVLGYLWPHVRHSRVRVPVVIYMAVLATMTWCAVARAAAPAAGRGATARSARYRSRLRTPCSR
jgi:uncharacterized membrane protein YhhN